MNFRFQQALKTTVAIFALVIASPSHAFTAANAPENAPDQAEVTQLGLYYQTATNGAIHVDPAFLQLTKSGLAAPLPSFTLERSWKGKLFKNFEYRPSEVTDLLVLQDLFKVDVEAFTRTYGGRDFMDSKRLQYKDLPFDPKLAQSQNPYPILQAWGNLSHPPIKHLDLPVEKYNSEFAPIDRTAIQSPYFTKSFQTDIDDASQTELTQGNILLHLPNTTAYDEKLRLVKAATKSIWIAMMVMDCSDTSMEILKILKEKMDQGVDVKILAEFLYAKVLPTSGCYHQVRKMGLPVTIVNEHFRKGGKLIGVFHDKFWVFDGKIAIVGGQNLVEMNNNGTGFNRHNRDGDVKVEGPSVTNFREDFLKIMERHNDGYLGEDELVKLKAEITEQKKLEHALGVRGAEHYDEWFADPNKRMAGVCRSIVQKSLAVEQSHAQILRRYIKGAQKSIWLSSPSLGNFEGEMNLFADLVDASKRNIHTTLVTNGIEGGDGELTIGFIQWAENARAAGKLTKASIIEWVRRTDQRRSAKGKMKQLWPLVHLDHFATWLYFQYIHEKKWEFDRLAVYIGGYNLDKQSSIVNHESGILCLDKSLVEQVERQFTLDAINSTPIIFKNSIVSETDVTDTGRDEGSSTKPTD